MKTIYRAQSIEPPPYYHPFQMEDFIVMEGEVKVKMDGTIKTLKQGATLHIPMGKAHSMWNGS